MKLAGFLGAALAMALVSTSTLAFQEQGAGAPAVTTPAPAAPGESANKGSVDQGDLSFSAPKPDTSDYGTEVRIPGLGKLGVLPKMDFGLELLYGANESAKQADPVEPPSDDLTIRGRVKHNF